jgi:hypothetical protein
MSTVQFAEAGGSKPSMADLASFASRANEISIGDDMVDLGDDLGMGLLANQSKVASSPRPVQRQVNFGGSTPSGGEMPQIQIKADEDLGLIDLDAAPGVADIKINRESEPAPFVIGGVGSDSDFSASATIAPPSVEDETQEKQKYLTKLQRLESSGVRGQRMTMNNSLAEIKSEYDKLTDSRNLEASIRFQRNALMTFVSGVEMVNDKFGNKLPVKPRLKGWSESVHTNIEDFDEIFEELYDLYKDKAKMHPMLRLVGTLGVSATMYHLTNSMAERSGIPGMADMMNEDPELQRIIAQKMAAKMGGLGQFMNAASGMGPPAPAPAPMGFGAPPPTPPRPQAFNMAANAAAEPPRARREMKGPSGVDDILKAFETERLMQAASNPIGTAHAGVFSPPGPPPTPPRGVSVLREGVGSSVDPMAEFLAGSGGSVDDGGSIMSGSTMNTERRRGRRRAAATPVGATLTLNV